MTCYLCAACVMKYSFMFCWNGVRVERVVKEGGEREEMKKKRIGKKGKSELEGCKRKRETERRKEMARE